MCTDTKSGFAISFIVFVHSICKLNPIHFVKTKQVFVLVCVCKKELWMCVTLHIHVHYIHFGRKHFSQLGC